MSDERDDGGPVFPTVEPSALHGGVTVSEFKRAVTGFSLRDHFAVEAMHASLAAGRGFDSTVYYAFADAMLKAREA